MDIYRPLALPEVRVRKTIIQQLAAGVGRVKTRLYRMAILCNIWGYALKNAGRVPMRLTEPWKEMFVDSMDVLGHIGFNQGLPTQEGAHSVICGMIDDQIAQWIAVRSVEMTDTPCWYSPGDDLLYTLAATRLSGVYAGDVQLPWPAFYLELPRGLIRHQSARGLHDVLCIGVSTGYEGGVRRLYLSSIQEPLPGDTGLDDISFHTASFTLEEGEPLEAQLQEQIRYVNSHHDPALGNFRASFCGGPLIPHTESLPRLFNLVLGFLLYLQEEQAEVFKRPPKQRSGKKGRDRKGRAAAKDLMSANTWLVGHQVRLDSRIRKAVREGGMRIAHNHSNAVPGHSQRYRVGPRLFDEEGRYIGEYINKRKEPYWRGGDGPILGKSYESPPPPAPGKKH